MAHSLLYLKKLLPTALSSPGRGFTYLPSAWCWFTLLITHFPFPWMYLPFLWAAVFNQSNLLSLSSEISLEVRVLLNKESPNIIRIFCSKSSKWPGLECWKEKVPAILARALFCLCPLCRIEMGSPRCWLWLFFQPVSGSSAVEMILKRILLVLVNKVCDI